MTLAGTLITPDSHEAWLAERQSGIGSSEAAAAIGVSEYEDDTPLNLYLRKLGLLPPLAENSAMTWGKRLEPLVAEAYMERIGCRYVADQHFARSSTYPHMLATVDRIRDDGRVVELKTAGARLADKWGPDGSDEIPANYVAQVTHQLIVLDAEVADVAVLIGGNDFRCYTIHRNPDVADAIIRREEAFWRCVTDRTPPEPQLADLGVMYALYASPDGTVSLTDAETALVARWEELGKLISGATKDRDAMKLEILKAIRNASLARLSDGRILTRKNVVKAAEKAPRAGYTYTDLRLKKGTA